MTPDQALAPIKARLEAATDGRDVEWCALTDPGDRKTAPAWIVDADDIEIRLPATYKAGKVAALIESAPTDITRLLAAVEAFAALHVKSDWEPGNPRPDGALEHGVCAWCGDVYPCPTLAALSEALGETNLSDYTEHLISMAGGDGEPTRLEAAAKTIARTYGADDATQSTARAALAAADKVMFSDEAIERAAHELYDHREGALTCYDHDSGWCCICGEHEIDIPWYEHGVRAVTTALRTAP